MDPQKTTAIVEALLFSADQTLTLRQLRSLLPDIDPAEVRAAVDLLKKEYPPGAGRHGIELAEVAGGYRFRSRADLAPWVGRLFQQTRLKLGRAQLETLAIIAYRQPITRAEIEAVRGVDSSGTVRSLLERDIVRIVGRKDLPGRPQLYGTNRRFLEVFGLRRLDELPSLEQEEFRDLQQKLPLVGGQEVDLPPPSDGAEAEVPRDGQGGWSHADGDPESERDEAPAAAVEPDGEHHDENQ